MVNILAPWIIWDRERNYRDSIVIWLVVSTILKNMKVNGKMIIPYMKWKIRNV